MMNMKHLAVVSQHGYWDMQLLKDLLSTRNQTRILISTEPILFWFDEYNSSIYIEDKHTSGSVIFQQDTESLFHSSYLLNFIPFELYLTYTPFSDTTILTY